MSTGKLQKSFMRCISWPYLVALVVFLADREIPDEMPHFIQVLIVRLEKYKLHGQKYDMIWNLKSEILQYI